MNVCSRVLILLLVACTAAVVCSCGSGEHIASETGDIDMDTLQFADTVGVLMGDTCCEFGTISSIEAVPEGIVVLDGVYCTISMFDSDGRFVSRYGGRGEGPGEYSNPWGICRLTGGEYLVFDQGSRKIILLDSAFRYIGSSACGMRIPLKLASGVDSTVVIQEIVIRFEDEQLFGGYRIYSMNAYTGEEGAVYRDCQLSMGAPDVDLRSRYCFFTTDSQGNVYLADYDSDEYEIEILSPEGEYQRTITLEPPQRIDFDVEAQALIMLPLQIPLTTESGTSNLIVSAPEKHPVVTDLAVDSEENIWVRRMGVADCETWDVVSQEGQLLRQVCVVADTAQGSGYYPALHVSPFGFAVTNSTEYEFERFFTVLCL